MPGTRKECQGPLLGRNYDFSRRLSSNGLTERGDDSSMVVLELLPAWSEYHQGSVPLQLPEGYRLMAHQWEVYRLLHESDVDVVFDTAMTGDGKTLAALLPLLRPFQGAVQSRGLYTYPTNELIRDQGIQVSAWAERFGAAIPAQTLTGDELTDYQREHHVTRFNALLDQLQGRRCLITNPDLLHLLLSFHYISDTQNAATLAQRLLNRFQYLVFDEFHTYDAAQVTALLDALLFAKAHLGSFSFKVLFLSATPAGSLTEALEDAGLRVRNVAGRYVHGAGNSLTHRLMLRGAHLEIHPNDDGVLAWCERNQDRIRQFFRGHPGSRGVIIVNSVFTAHRLAYSLQQWLPELRVATNTGVTGRHQREVSHSADLVVATSTIDVGVDLHINLLIFESLGAGTFLQRLGRLGRHEGYDGHHFDTFLAIGLLPTYLAERLANVFPSGSVITRGSLYDAVQTVDGAGIFPEPNRFAGYLSRWGTIQSMQRLFVLGQRRNRGEYGELINRYQGLATRVFDYTRGNQARTLALFRRDSTEKAVALELLALRGAGQLDIWVHYPPERGVTAVNLFRLLAGTDFHLITRAEAEAICHREVRTFHRPALDLYAVIDGFLDERNSVQLRFEGRFKDKPLNMASERTGFIALAAHQQIRQINRQLLRLPVTTMVSVSRPETLRRRWALPPLFGLHRVTDQTEGEFSVAFGHDALLLDSLYQGPRAGAARGVGEP